MAEYVEKAASCLPGIFTKLSDCLGKTVEDGSYDTDNGPLSHSMKDIIHGLSRRMSMSGSPSVTRITITSISKKPKSLVKMSPEKSASAEPDFLASEYAKYQLSYASNSENRGNDKILMLTALQNYVK